MEQDLGKYFGTNSLDKIKTFFALRIETNIEIYN
jgi:hypothetical protein